MKSVTAFPEPDRISGAPHPRDTLRLIGQSEAENNFLAAFNSNRLHHGWLINGPRGVGKATLAWKIARFLLATPDDDGGMFAAPPPQNLDIPDSHPVAHRLAALTESRLFLLRRPYDEKAARLKQDITVDEVRKMKSFFALSAADGGRRVAIIDKAGKVVAALGDNPDQKQWAQFKLAPEFWRDGIFIAPHGVAFDRKGNLIVQDWNFAGRVTMLRHAPKR